MSIVCLAALTCLCGSWWPVPICYLSPLPYAYDVHNLVRLTRWLVSWKNSILYRAEFFFQVKFMIDIGGSGYAMLQPRGAHGHTFQTCRKMISSFHLSTNRSKINPPFYLSSGYDNGSSTVLLMARQVWVVIGRRSFLRYEYRVFSPVYALDCARKRTVLCIMISPKLKQSKPNQFIIFERSDVCFEAV